MSIGHIFSVMMCRWWLKCEILTSNYRSMKMFRAMHRAFHPNDQRQAAIDSYLLWKSSLETFNGSSLTLPLFCYLLHSFDFQVILYVQYSNPSLFWLPPFFLVRLSFPLFWSHAPFFQNHFVKSCKLLPLANQVLVSFFSVDILHWYRFLLYHFLSFM